MDAASYLASIGSLNRFHRSAEVWASAGFDPITDGSGDHPDRVGHISKHSDPALQHTMFQMGYRVSQNYAPVTITFLDAFDRKSEVEATIHAAHRVNRNGNQAVGGGVALPVLAIKNTDAFFWYAEPDPLGGGIGLG